MNGHTGATRIAGGICGGDVSTLGATAESYGALIQATDPSERMVIADSIIVGGSTSGTGTPLSVAVFAYTMADILVSRSILMAHSSDGVVDAVRFQSTGSAYPDPALGLEDNILFTQGPTFRRCINEQLGPIALTSNNGNLLADCPTALYIDYLPPTRVYDTACGGNLGDAGCANVLSPAATGTLTATLATDVFASGFDAEDYKTWVIQTGGPADRDGTPGWSAGDPGVDPATVGAP